MMVQLYDDERIDFLLAKQNMRIIQSPTVFAFSSMLYYWLILHMYLKREERFLTFVQGTASFLYFYPPVLTYP